jgi:hypothetical protein
MCFEMPHASTRLTRSDPSEGRAVPYSLPKVMMVLGKAYAAGSSIKGSAMSCDKKGSRPDLAVADVLLC